MAFHVGVSRTTIKLRWPPLPDEEAIESTGRLWTAPVHADPDRPEMLVGDIVIYLVDETRLLGMLAAARAGDTDEDILLALNAAALDNPDDGDGAEWIPEDGDG